ncbi:MAG: glycosyl hydrolase 2 galactose-binding domain-containing protein [Bariatricus sp.]
MKKIDLNGTWKMNQRGEAVQYEAKIPGSVLSTLLAADAIPDPYDRMNEYQTRELFWEDYIFQREFELEEEFLEEEKIELVCEGLDTLADIYLNDKKVFYANNMHRTWRIPIGAYLHPGRNKIRIEFLSVLKYMDAYQYAENKEVKFIACGAMKGNQLVRKAHSMFGWDWGPQLVDAGIFRDIYLEGWTGRRMEEVEIRQKIIKEEKDRKKDKKVAGKAELMVTVRFADSLEKFPNQGILRERVQDINLQEQHLRIGVWDRTMNELADELEVVLGEGMEWQGKLAIQEPKLWWPNGYGEQPLYELSVQLLDSDGMVEQEEKKTIGIRTLTVSREKDQWGREFAFQVNGIKIFAMGANYIPEDCIYSRITKERINFLLESAKRAHFNCIRVWGGGYYPSDDFYELCDEKGLIVWQDLMFACNVYDVTDAFLENCQKEIEDNVKRLRHHPSLGLWCGNNEIESAWDHWPDFQKETKNLRADYIRLFEHVIPQIMKKYAGDTFFWPSSPSAGGCFANPDDENNGDAHYWDVWHGQKPFTDYRKYFFRFCSEFGFQSFPSLKTVKTFTKPEDRNIFSRVMESHQKNDAANGKLLYYLSENFRYPESFDELLYVSQILQGMAIQYGVEHWRRKRGRCMGTLFWQLNDIWPAASWSSIDYFGRWKALQYMACRFYAPVTASLTNEEKNFALYVENETASQVGWKGEILLKDMDCKILEKVEVQGSTKGFSSEKIAEMNLKNLCEEKKMDIEWQENVFVEGKVCFADGTEVHQVETLLPYKYLALKKPEIEVQIEEQEDAYVIQLKSSVFAPFVELDIEDADVIFSDNYFHLTGDKYKVLVKKEDIKNVEWNLKVRVGTGVFSFSSVPD